MNLQIRNSNVNDLQKYTDLLQRTYEFGYTNNELGLTKNCFSKEIFASKNTQDYLRSHLTNSVKQKTWLAYLGDDLVGSITCIIMNDKEAELTGFYVHPAHQGRGIGKKLYNLALSFGGDREFVLDVYLHALKSVEMYKRWGWRLDKTKGVKGYFYRHWPEWPKGLQAKCMYMRRVN